MRTTPADKIRDYRARGWWGDTRIHDLFDANARANPDRLAIVDAPNRADLVGTPAQRLTFAAAAALADGYSLSLARLGLGKDDVLVTREGHEVLTHGVPKDPAAIEALMAAAGAP